MKKLILFLIICTTLFACKKHQDPLPNVTNGMVTTPTDTTDTTDYLRPRRSTFKYIGSDNLLISDYKYYSNGLLRKITQYDSLQKSAGDSIIFTYTDGWLTKKISYTNSYQEVTTELFTYDRVAYGLISLVTSYTKINAHETKKYIYYYSNYTVYNILGINDLSNKLIDSISIVNNTAITFLGKGEINPNNPNPYDPALCGYREKKEAHYFITNNEIFPDYGLITYDPSDLTQMHPIYNFGLYQLNNTNYSNIHNPFQKELADYLMPDAVNNYPEAGFFNKPLRPALDPNLRFNYLVSSNDLRYRVYTKLNSYVLLSFESHYIQKNTGRGSLTPEGSKTTLYFNNTLN